MQCAPFGYDVIVSYPIFDLWINDFLGLLVKTYAIGYITAEIAVLAAMQFGPQAFGATLILSAATKGLTLALSWDSVEGLKSIFIGAWVSLILGTVGTIKMFHSGIVSLAFGFLEAASKAGLWKFIYKFVYIPINMALLLVTLNRLNELGGI